MEKGKESQTAARFSWRVLASPVLAGKGMRLEPFDLRHCGISVIAYFQNTAGQGPEQPEVRSDMTKKLLQMTSKDPFQPALF